MYASCRFLNNTKVLSKHCGNKHRLLIEEHTTSSKATAYLFHKHKINVVNQIQSVNGKQLIIHKVFKQNKNKKRTYKDVDINYVDQRICSPNSCVDETN